MNVKKIMGAFIVFLGVLYVASLVRGVFLPKDSDAVIEAQASELGATERAWAEKGRAKDEGEDKLEALAKGKGLPPKTPATVPPEAAAPAVAQIQPVVATEAPAKSCSQEDAIFGRNGCKPSDLKEAEATPVALASPQPTPAAPSAPARSYTPPPSSGPRVASNSGPALSSAAASILAGKGLSAEPTEISGMSKSYPGPVIRAGCYLITEMVEDELIVVSGAEHMLSLDVRGAMPGCKLPPVWPIRLVAYVSLNGPQNRIVGKVKACTGGKNDQKTIECKARIKDVSGADGLPGQVYDQSGWAIVLDLALSIATAPTIANLTKEVAGAQNFWAGAASQEIAGTLQKSIQRVSEKINKAFDGREIHLKKYYHNGKPVGPFVMVAFEEDALL